MSDSNNKSKAKFETEKKEKKRYHLIPADFEVFDFKKLKNEISSKKTLLWHSEYWYKDKKTGEWKNKKYHYNKSDVVYLYYKNIPDFSKRILLRGEIAEIDKEDTWYFGDEKKEMMCKCIEIKNLRPVELKNLTKYSYNELVSEEKYKLTSTYRQEITGKQELINDIENDYDKNGTIEQVIEYFDGKSYCECCKILNLGPKERMKRTFVKSNGLIYREIHHLLMQNIKRKSSEWFKEKKFLNENDIQMIDKEFNEINLCPVCHKEFHYGNFDAKSNNNIRKKEIIEKILEEHNYNKHLKDWGKSPEEIQKIRKYILEQYGIFEN